MVDALVLVILLIPRLLSMFLPFLQSYTGVDHP